MNKPQIKTVKITLAGDATENSASIKIPAASQIFIGAIALPAPSKLTRLSVEENGNTIHEAMHIGWFDGQLGTFQQRSRVLNTNGCVTLDVKIQVSSALGTDIEVEVAFEIYQNPVVAFDNDELIVPGVSC